MTFGLTAERSLSLLKKTSTQCIHIYLTVFVAYLHTDSYQATHVYSSKLRFLWRIASCEVKT